MCPTRAPSQHSSPGWLGTRLAVGDLRKWGDVAGSPCPGLDRQLGPGKPRRTPSGLFALEGETISRHSWLQRCPWRFWGEEEVAVGKGRYSG